MSNLGGWHNYYNSNRAISNELGGKWELFFEETRTQSGAVDYEWDKNSDNTPLHLNGIMIIIRQNKIPSIAYHTLKVNGVTEIKLQNGASSNDNLVTVIKSKISNGLLETFGKSRMVESSEESVQLQSGSSNQLTNSITSFKYSASSLPKDSEIKVYVLRGV